MSSFSETDVRRDGSGKFADKPPAAEAGIELGEQKLAGVHERRGAARDALDRFDPTTCRERDPGTMRSVRSSLEFALDDRAGNDAQAEGMTLAAAMVRERSGMDEDDAHTYMRGLAPHLSDEEVVTFTKDSAARMDEAAAHQKEGDSERVSELMGAQKYDAERLVACSAERGDPTATTPPPPAPVPPNADEISEYTLPFDDPGVRARREERAAITAASDEPVWGARGELDPANLSSEKLKDSRAAQDVYSVLVQRGVHPTEADAVAVRVTRASCLSTWYAEGGADAMSAADHYDFSRRNAVGHETVVAVPADEFSTSEAEVSPAYGGGYETNMESGVDRDSWASANSDAWGDIADTELRTALGHPKFKRD